MAKQHKKPVKKSSKKKPAKTGRTDRKSSHPKFTASQITDDNLSLFLQVFPEPHRQFAMEYSKTWNAKRSYQKIHPKAKDSTAKVNGFKLLQDEKIQMFLHYMADKNAEQFQISKEWLILKQKEVLDQAMDAVPVYGFDGKPTGRWTFNAQAANYAIKTLGTEVDFGSTRLKVENTGSRDVVAAVYVVEELRPIDMADQKFQGDLTKTIKEHMKDRMKKK